MRGTTDWAAASKSSSLLASLLRFLAGTGRAGLAPLLGSLPRNQPKGGQRAVQLQGMPGLLTRATQTSSSHVVAMSIEAEAIGENERTSPVICPMLECQPCAPPWPQPLSRNRFCTQQRR